MSDCSSLYISEGRITEIELTYYSGNGEKHKPHSMRFRSLEHRLANFFETVLDLNFKVELINLLMRVGSERAEDNTAIPYRASTG